MMERISSCGPVLASLDPECYSWAREASGPPDHLEVSHLREGLMKGNCLDMTRLGTVYPILRYTMSVHFCTVGGGTSRAT